MLLLRQIQTLIWKNFLVSTLRHPISTPLRAFIFPVIFAWFLSYARNLFIPPSIFGIGSAVPIRSLEDVFANAGGGRRTLALVNNGFRGGAIDQVIQQFAGRPGMDVQVLDHEEELLTVCRNSLRGASSCIAGVVFYSSPDEGPGGIWNYTLHADGAFGQKVVVTADNNDQEIYTLPVQHAIDLAISSTNPSDNGALGRQTILEYPFTSETQQQRADRIRQRYMSGIIDILGVAFFISVSGITYQLTGMMASERESTMSQLIEAMMPNIRRWQPQFARLTSYHAAFSLIYLPSWILIGVIFGRGVFAKTNLGVLIIFHILAGLSLASWSIFGASFFKKSQLSGIIVNIASLLFGVLAQVLNKNLSEGAVIITGLLFPPMNYVYFIVVMARWEAQNTATDLVKSPPDGTFSTPGIVFWVLFIIQALAYPLLGGLVERTLWGTASGQRHLTSSNASEATVEIRSFSKHYTPGWFRRNILRRFGAKEKDTVIAVKDLNLKALPGQIVVLLGANGSGKSTTLDALAGLTSITSGDISLDGRNGLGYCPQKNVLFKECTVMENADIFNRLKSIDSASLASKDDLRQLITACDLDRKIDALASSLSGGQMRKLQLSMMFVGNSRVCLVDECTSGVDALARRKLQDILLAERSRSNRTIIFTTHFLDEADVLSDNIYILSKGSLKLHGTAPEIKAKMGFYRIHVFLTPGDPSPPDFPGIARNDMFDQTQFSVSDAATASKLLTELDSTGFKYQISGPTVEDAFMKVSAEMEGVDEKFTRGNSRPQALYEDEKTLSDEKHTALDIRHSASDEKRSTSRSITRELSLERNLELKNGKHVTPLRQGWILLSKRATIFRRNALPNMIAFLIPIVASGLASLYLRGFVGAGCSPSAQATQFSDPSSLATQVNYTLLIGPSSRFTDADLDLITSTIPPNILPNGLTYPPGINVSSILRSSIKLVDSITDFNNYINQNFANVTPGGFYLGDETSPPTFAYKGDGNSVDLASITQNLFDTVLTNTSIATQYQPFDIPWQANQGSTLQFSVYFGLAFSIFPAFFSLYPCIERLRSVRALHYSNSVRALPLWLAYITWDFAFVLASTVITVIIFRGFTDIWYNLGYLFVVLFLFGLCGTLFSYVVSLFAKSQLAAFAIAAGTQAGEFLLYIIAYLSVLTYAPVNKIDDYLVIVHFTLALIFPAGSLIRALFVSLNIFSIDCKDRVLASYPGAMTVYGGPILYLLLQSFALFAFLVWWDSKSSFGMFRRKQRVEDHEVVEVVDDEISAEVHRVMTSTDDGLRVLHVSKSYGKTQAVSDVTFGVRRRGEVFALLGPNGAGKSTTISMIRGDILPSNREGEILIENDSVIKHRAAARQHLGVCPQFDATDTMTAIEHLQFYARIRGVDEVDYNVAEVIRAVGLTAFQTRMAASLSGGNKRKLSLAIALMGNPSVLLLDEPSSGMDVRAKRVMWQTLTSVAAGRSIVLTTHSMEEADALANRAAILAGKLLALGTSDYLRRKHGDRLHVHLLMKTAPYTTVDEVDGVKAWISTTFPEALIDEKNFHGQIRFNVPAKSSMQFHDSRNSRTAASEEQDPISMVDDKAEFRVSEAQTQSPIANLFSTLEAGKKEVGYEYYSVGQTTLDQVFLSIVGKHAVEEEGYEAERKEAEGAKKRSIWNAVRPKRSGD